MRIRKLEFVAKTQFLNFHFSDYVDPGLRGFHDKTGMQEQEFLSRKSSGSSTTSLDRHEMRLSIAGRNYSSSEDRSYGVRAKIAMFSHGKSESKSTLGKFQSSEDIGKLSGFSNSMVRAHTQGDVRFEDGLKKQGLQQSLKSLNTINSSRAGMENKGVSNLKPQNRNTSFRSMINVSNHRDTAKHVEDKAVSVIDLSGSNPPPILEDLEKPCAINYRSQSLSEICGSMKTPDISVKGRSSSSNILGQNSEPNRKGISGLEQRRRSTMSKLKGLIIPEGKESASAENHDVSKTKVSTCDASLISSKLTTPPWKDKNDSNDFPKYSPAFKRKPFSVYNTNERSTSSPEDKVENVKPGSTRKPQTDDKRRREKGAVSLNPKGPSDQTFNKPPIGKRNSDEGLYLQSKLEDSDNDSAVSSGRSSVSGRSSSPTNSELRAEELKLSDGNPRLLKKNSIEAINRQNVMNVCKKRSSTLAQKDAKDMVSNKIEMINPDSRSGKPAVRSSSFNITERLKGLDGELTLSRRESNSSQDSLSRRSSRDIPEKQTVRRSSREPIEQITLRKISYKGTDEGSRRGSRVATPTGNQTFPDSINDISEKVSYMNDVVDRTTSTTPTDRRSLSRTNSVASERSYSSRSSRNSSIVSEKAPFCRTSSMLSKDSAISEDFGFDSGSSAPSTRKNSDKWVELEKKYSKGVSPESIENKIYKLKGINEDNQMKTERPKDLAISQKKNSLNSPSTPGAKNFKELAEKWQTFSSETPTPTQTTLISPGSNFATLPRKSSKEKTNSLETTPTLPVAVELTSIPRGRDETSGIPRGRDESSGIPRERDETSGLPRGRDETSGMSRGQDETSGIPRGRDENSGIPRGQEDDSPVKLYEEFPWSPPNVKNSYYQVSGDTEWSGFDMVGKTDIPDRKFSVPVYNESAIKLRDKKDNVPSRPSSLIESTDQKDLKIFEIGNLGDCNRMLMNSNSTSRSSSQADMLDSMNSDTPKSPLPSSSSREILDAFSNRSSRRAVSVNDIRRAFEKAEKSLSNYGTPTRSGLSTSSSHNRMSSLDSTTSEESSIPTPHFHGSVSSLASGHGGLRDHYGSITSLASSTSMISPQVNDYFLKLFSLYNYIFWLLIR